MVVSSQAHCSLDLDSGIKDWSATQIVESEVLLNQEGITTQKVVHVFWLHFDAPIDESFYSDRVFETQTSCSFHQKPSDFHSIIIGLSHNLISLLIKSPKGVLKKNTSSNHLHPSWVDRSLAHGETCWFRFGHGAA